MAQLVPSHPALASLATALLLALGCGGNDDNDPIIASCGDGLELCAGTCVAVGTCGAGTGGQSSTGGQGNTGGGNTGGGNTGGQSTTGGQGNTGGSGNASPGECTDVSTTQGSMNVQYGTAMLQANNNKIYVLQSNWWSIFSGQTLNYDGLSFTVSNQGANAGSSGAPAGYPSLFIGNYAGHHTTNSNLPKQVSALTAVPTIFHTNATDLDTSNFNAAYDVWFTQSSEPLGEGQYSPGTGGAFLMVWLFKPSNRQPRGSNQAPNHTVAGAPSTWNVWIDRSDPPCISYVSTTPMSDIDFDLNDFIRDSVDNGYGLTDSMYLNTVFAGLEVWSGAEGASVEQFCANVE